MAPKDSLVDRRRLRPSLKSQTAHGRPNARSELPSVEWADGEESWDCSRRRLSDLGDLSLHAKPRCTRTGAASASASASGVGNTAMMWKTFGKVKSRKKKGQGSGGEGLAAAFTWSESHLTETPNSEGAHLFAAASRPVVGQMEQEGTGGSHCLPAYLPQQQTGLKEEKYEFLKKKKNTYVQEGLGGFPFDPCPPRTHVALCPPITRCPDRQTSLTSIGDTSHSEACKSTATHTPSPPANQFLHTGTNAEPSLLAPSMRWRWRWR